MPLSRKLTVSTKNTDVLTMNGMQLIEGPFG